MRGGDAYGEGEVYYYAKTDESGFNWNEKQKKYERTDFSGE